MFFNELKTYKWHYDYSRLAWDSGFVFGKQNYSISDRNKSYFVDIERIIKERDVSAVEENIPFVCEYKLDSEQAAILDKTFVNMFRIGQLSVDYLLFCRMYLDHTVINLKQEITTLNEENSELKAFIAELEHQITGLTSYKCEKCAKVFSSEVYLQSHRKRRHNEDETDSYTNKLHLEIKELKERLNSTEKLMKDQTEKKDDRNEDIKYKFDEFRNEIAEKLFEIGEKTKTVQNSTQTDLEMRRKVILTTELTHDKNVFVYREMSDEEASENGTETRNFDEKFEKFEEQIESKVSQAIQMKMEDVWEKIAQMKHESPVEIRKPEPKPRTNFTKSKKKTENMKIEHFEPVFVQGKSMYTSSESEHSFSDLKIKVDSKNRENVSGTVKEAFKMRLHQFGISHEWKSLPRETFEKTMRIVNHRNGKRHALIRNRIEKQLEERLKNRGKRSNRTRNQLKPTLYQTESEESVEMKREALPERYSSIVDEVKAKKRVIFDVDEPEDVESVSDFDFTHL